LPATNHHSDQQLLSLLKQGDQEAFTQLYHLYSERLYLNLQRMLKSGPLAEELLQEIFILLWEKRETITVHTSFPAYLQRVAENKVIDFFRKARRSKTLYEQLKVVSPEQYLYPEAYLCSKDQAGLLAKALETLSPQRKLVFVSCKLQGKSYYEVSELLGISTSTINDHIVKATRIIRQFMLKHREMTSFLILVAAWHGLI
jgi:RNA polymerase sigma-70 factor (ECF subfamily)